MKNTAEVLWEQRGRVRIMTLNRPEALNAITPEGEQLQSRYLQEFQADEEAWVLIITGAGRAFSTGLDLSRVAEVTGNPRRPPTLIGPEPLELWKPVIAAVGGYALGGGCELAMACDIRIAADDARLGLAEEKRGLIPGAGGTQRLPRLVGLGDALLLLFSGDWVEAREALRIGLVQKVVPREQLLPEAVALAERICENGPLAVRAVKEAVYRGTALPLAAGLHVERLTAFRVRQTEDAREGPRAFVEKRKPVFAGR